MSLLEAISFNGCRRCYGSSLCLRHKAIFLAGPLTSIVAPCRFTSRLGIGWRGAITAIAWADRTE